MKAIYHKIVARKYVAAYASSLLLMVISSQVSAACSRDDITFYLDKGFTAEQITAMCSEPSAPAAAKQNNGQQSAPPLADENVLFLSRAIKGHKIKQSTDSLQYTLKKFCIEYGEQDIFGFAPKVCPDVIFTISLKELVVLDTDLEYGFYGAQQIQVKSSAIKREIIGELKDKTPDERELILDAFEKGNETTIPVRDDYSMQRVKQVLQELSN